MIEKTLLIVGDDKLSRKALNAIQLPGDVIVAVDKSTNINRAIRLIARRSLTISLLVKMFFCEKKRQNYKSKKEYDCIYKNEDILRMVEKYNPGRIVLFRAGLIISKKVIETGVAVMNIHCAKLPGFGGIGSINRALHEKEYQQYATLHRVTEKIDEGVVYDKEYYTLISDDSYCDNENRAYNAGIKLLERTLNKVT